LTFEIGSKLIRIEARTFSGCASLGSILIPRSVKELCWFWALQSSLRQVVFESALSFWTMIETNKIDLRPGFEIKCVDHDCSPDRPGFSVQTVSRVDDLMHLLGLHA
jgi:hypothetical protein